LTAETPPRPKTTARGPVNSQTWGSPKSEDKIKRKAEGDLSAFDLMEARDGREAVGELSGRWLMNENSGSRPKKSALAKNNKKS
jgi:hypothetical protein